VHELDLRNARARCIDLLGTGDFTAGTSYAMELSPDGRTLWAVSPGYGRVAAIDVRSAKVKLAFRFRRDGSTDAPTGTVSALSPNGAQLAVAVGGKLWFVSTTRHTVVRAKQRLPLALGFSTDGSKLWALVKNDAVVALPVA
jgi:DNA-binding beta-propeller fold protein YncE